MKNTNPKATKAVYPIICQIVNTIPTQFLANNLTWSARTVAEIYRDRRGIETFFKELKQTC